MDPFLSRLPRANIDEDRRSVRPVHQMMRAGTSGRESLEGPLLHRMFTIVVDQGECSRQHVNELVFCLMPVPQRRYRTRFKRDMIHAELGNIDGARQTCFVLSGEQFRLDATGPGTLQPRRDRHARKSSYPGYHPDSVLCRLATERAVAVAEEIEPAGCADLGLVSRQYRAR